MASHSFCKLSELPKIKDMPQGCAWGYYADKSKKERDELGTLNLLTPERIKAAAASQIKTGIRVQLDWPLSNCKFPGFQRQGLQQKIIDLNIPPIWMGADDIVSFNTQCGSQWDGLRHCAHRASKTYYNGLTHEEIMASNGTGNGDTRNGINEWCKTGGIVGRGVFLDWVRWKEQTSKEPLPSPVSRYEIPHTDLDKVAQYQGTQFEVGDILIVRSGFVRWHNEADDEARKVGTMNNSTFIGIHNTDEAIEWFWDHHFAAVAGDTVAFEAWAPNAEQQSMHEWFLSMWGCPIGEMWDLETLSKVCEEQKRWTFFLTSAPLHVPGGVGSPPNVIATF